MAIPVGKAPHKKPFVFSRPGSETSKPVSTPHSAAADEAKHQGEKYNVYLKDKEYLTQIYQKFGIDKEPTAKDVQTWRDAMQNFSETHGHNIGDTIPAKSWANSYQSNYFALEGTDAIPSDKKMETMNLLKSAMNEIELQSRSEQRAMPSSDGFEMTGSNFYHAVITKEMDDALSGKLINQPGVQSTAAQEAQRKGEEYAKWLEAQKDNTVEIPHPIETNVAMPDVTAPEITMPEVTTEPSWNLDSIVTEPPQTMPEPEPEPEVDVHSGDARPVRESDRHDIPHSIEDVSSHIEDSRARADYVNKLHPSGDGNARTEYRQGAGHDRGQKPTYVPDGTARDSAHYEGQKYQQWLDSQKGPGAQTAQTEAAKNIASARWTPTTGAQVGSVASQVKEMHDKRLDVIKKDPFNTHSYAKEQAEHDGDRYQKWLNEQKGPGAETAKIEELKARAAARAKELGEPEPDEAMLGIIKDQPDNVNIKNDVLDSSESVLNDNVHVEMNTPEPPIMPEPTTAPQVHHQAKLNMLDQSGVSQIAANALNAGKVASVTTPQAGA